jgi:hydrogenase expression/formation protein HypD
MAARELFDPAAVRALVEKVAVAAAPLDRRVTFMEVCGSHTHAISAAGLRRLLPETVRLISGPGCPVCVTPVEFVDRAVALASRPGTTVCTFGDLLRVPGSVCSLEEARAEGADVRVVYSPRDAVAVARENGGRTVAFLGVGFETTTPTVAGALTEAENTGVANFMILSGHKVMPPPLEALAADPDLAVDGFICPGHVSVITGWRIYAFLPERYGRGAVVAGFTPTDVLRAVLELVEQAAAGRPALVNAYPRVVTEHGNAAAHALVGRFFEPADVAWRGLGVIPGSGLALKEAFAHRDAGRIAVTLPPSREPAGCRCGEVLKGRIDPPECPLFGRVCTPDCAVGACMVSSEGACAAWFRHERYRTVGSRTEDSRPQTHEGS